MSDDQNLPTKTLWSYEQEQVANLKAFTSKTQAQIAEEVGLPVSAVAKWLKIPEFQSYINKLTLEAAQELKARNIRLINMAIEQALEEAEASGNWRAIFGRKDTADLIQIQDELLRKNENAQQAGLMSQLEELIKRGKERNTKVVEINPSEPKK